MHQAEQPFEPQPAYPQRRSRHGAGEEIEQRADGHRQRAVASVICLAIHNSWRGTPMATSSTSGRNASMRSRITGSSAGEK